MSGLNIFSWLLLRIGAWFACVHICLTAYVLIKHSMINKPKFKALLREVFAFLFLLLFILSLGYIAWLKFKLLQN